MKFTNVKQLIIKFMGGGLINFPTRFLRWVKINGDSDDSDDGGSDGGDSVDFNIILDNISIKDDLLTKLQAIDYTNQGEDGVLTDLTFDDVFNDYNDFIKSYLYRQVLPTISDIVFIQYNQKIELIKQNNDVFFAIQDENRTAYNVYIVDENNNIQIYVIKETEQPPI